MRSTAWRVSLLVAVLVCSLPARGRAEVQPGDTITTANLTQAADLLTPATRWMVERGMPMPIIASKRVHWPQAYQEATEKYAGQVKLAADGRDISNYIAGCPFPFIDSTDPLAAYRIMWDHEQSPGIIDNLGTEVVSDLVDSTGTTVRTYDFPWRRLMWVGRLYTDPKPVLSHNPPLRHSNLFGPYSLPNDLHQLMILFFRYLPRDTPDETYLYLPELRRVRSLNFANRSDALGGTDFDVDTFYGFNGNIRHWTFRLLADKVILAVVHSGKYGDPAEWCASRDSRQGILAALPCVAWEKRRVWVIEATPTGYPRTYAYSKRILYIDQDFYAPLLQEMYDQQGALWKTLLLCISYSTQPYAGYPVRPVEGGKYHYTDEWPFTPNWVLLDLQRVQATTGEAPLSREPSREWRQEWYFNENVTQNQPEIYSLNSLLRNGR